MLKSRSFRFVAIIFTLMVISASAYGQRFAAQLDQAQEVPPTGSAGVGYGSVVLSPDQTQITVNLGFTGLGSNANAAHIHTGAVGVNGGVTFGLSGVPAATSGVIPSQTFPISAGQLADLLAGNMYFNIHSDSVPGGEIRGQILAPACTTGQPIEIHATSGTMGPTGYLLFNLATTAINGGTHRGAIDVEVCGNTNELAVTSTLNASGSGSALYTSIFVSPVGGAARTITGAAAAGSPMIDINGADNLTINGFNTGGNSLTISNTTVSSTSGTSTIRFQTDATNNTITNANIQGSATMAAGTNGGNIWFGAAAITTGSDNNTISNNNIGPAGANLPTKGIYFSGSSNTDPGTANSGNTVNGNNIFDYFSATVASAGIDSNSGSVGTIISNNKFYQTATRTQTSSSQHSAIRISNGSGNNFQITGNTIGFANAAGTGTYTFVGVSGSLFYPISLVVGTTTATSVQGNTIAGIAISGAMSGTSSTAPAIGIAMTSTSAGLVNIGNVTGNTIGSQSATGSITYTSSSASASDFIGMFNFGSSNWTTNNNNIGGVTVSNSSTGAANFYGIRVNTSSSQTWTCLNNTIGGTVANSINSTSTATGTIVQGMLDSSPALTATGNTIRNLTAAGGTGTVTSASVGGIVVAASSANHTVGQNTIFNLSNTNATAATVVTGIQYTGTTGTNLVERNFIYALTSSTTSATAEVNGIRSAGGTTAYRNNMIAVGAGIANAIGAAATNAGTTGVNGINEVGGTNTYFHNSVYIGGGPVAGSGASYAFNGTVTTNTRSFRNNIFNNSRTNAGVAAGANYAVKINGTAPNPAGLTINNNLYNANGAGAVFGFFNSLAVANLGAWQTAVGQDAASVSGDPLYVGPAAATPDLHIGAGSPAINAAASLGVTNDFDGETRPGGNAQFDIGADERDGIAPVVNDIQATAFLDPSNGGTKLQGATFSPQASFTNNGTAGQLNVTVRYRICADVGCTTEVYNQTAVIASIASLATVNVTFPSTSIATTGTYTIKARSELGTDTVPANNEITGTLIIAGPLSGTYTVGTGGNYPSLTNNGGIFEAINALGVTTGVDIQILNSLSGELGTHGLNQIAGGASVLIYPCGNPITITGSNTGALIRLNGADSVTIDGDSAACSPGAAVGGTPAQRHLTITNTNTGTSSAVVGLISLGAGAGATGNTIRNVNLVGTTLTATNGTLFGIYSGAAGISIAGNGPDNDNNTFQNNNITKSQYGIYSAGESALNKNTGTVISQNQMNAASPNNLNTGGIFLRFEDGALIDQNDISVLRHDGTAGQVQTAFGIALGVVPNNTVTAFTGSDVTGAQVLRNKINGVTQLNSTGYSAFGIVVNSVTSGNTLLQNNMISGVRSPSTADDFSGGIIAGGGTGSTTRIYHNSVAMTGTRASTTTFPSYGLAIAAGDPIMDVKNNIFYNTQSTTGTGKMYAIATGGTTFANLDSNYNDFYVTGTNTFVGQTGGLGTTGTDRATLATWQTATGGTASDDGSSQAVDPVFVNPANDLHLEYNLTAPDTPLLGDALIGFASDDHDGDPRPGSTAPDIGADELVQSEFQIFPAGTFYNAVTAPADQMAGSVTITNSITLNGILVTGVFNTLTIDCNATVQNVGGLNYVDGTVNKQYCGTGTFTYPVGSTPDNQRATSPQGIPVSEYSPVTVNVTAGTFPSYLSVKVFDATIVGFDPANSLSRNWELNELGDITANLSFTYLNGPPGPNDVNGTEASYIVYRRNADGTTDPMCVAACVDTTNNILGPTVSVSDFSRWSGAALAPTAAGVDVGGRVLTPNGGGLRNAIVVLTDSRGVSRFARTGGFGYYRFEDVRAGETYVITVNSKKYQFTPRTLQVLDTLNDVDFVADIEQ